jgi:hypothetical protein
MATKKTAKTATKETKEKKQTRPTFADGDKGKQERFAFYATLRMTRALKLISQLKNLTNPVIYSSTEDQRRKMCDTLSIALGEMEQKYFSATGDTKGSRFQF